MPNHHIYLRQGEWHGRVEVHAITGLVEVVVIQGETLAPEWPTPSFGL